MRRRAGSRRRAAGRRKWRIAATRIGARILLSTSDRDAGPRHIHTGHIGAHALCRGSLSRARRYRVQQSRPCHCEVESQEAREERKDAAEVLHADRITPSSGGGSPDAQCTLACLRARAFRMHSYRMHNGISDCVSWVARIPTPPRTSPRGARLQGVGNGTILPRFCHRVIPGWEPEGIRIMEITAIFWDLGGVLLTNGWDREQRARAALHFSLDADEFEDRHRETVALLETGRCTLSEYLRATVFHRERSFTEAEFRSFMEGQSESFAENLAIVDYLAATGRYLLSTLNNESRELNEYRVERFSLRRKFTCFFTSAYVGAMKPSEEIYQAALDISQRQPQKVLFIDDREQNLEPARQFGIHTLRFRAEEGAGILRARLADFGIQA